MYRLLGKFTYAQSRKVQVLWTRRSICVWHNYWNSVLVLTITLWYLLKEHVLAQEDLLRLGQAEDQWKVSVKDGVLGANDSIFTPQNLLTAQTYEDMIGVVKQYKDDALKREKEAERGAKRGEVAKGATLWRGGKRTIQ